MSVMRPGACAECAMSRSAFLTVLLTTSLAGCATVVGDFDQTVTIRTDCRERVLQSHCIASNDKGAWSFNTPAQLILPRSSQPLHITCPGGLVEDAHATSYAWPSLSTLGNVLMGGFFGLTVDIYNTTAFGYPPVIHVDLPICRHL